MTDEPRRADTVRHAKAAQRDPDSDSWGPLTTKIRERLRGYRANRLPPNLEHDDFVSEVILRVLRDLPGVEIRTRGEFWSWIQTVADHALTDLWRRARAQKRGPAPEASGDDDAEATAPPHAAPTPSSVQRAHEIERAERDCIERLPNDLAQTVYRLRRGEDLAFAAIAARTGQASAASARFVFFRAKQAVQECLRRKLETGYSGFFRSLDGEG